MKYRLLIFAVLTVFLMSFVARAATKFSDGNALPVSKLLKTGYVQSTPGSVVQAGLTDGMEVTFNSVSTVTDIMCARLRPMSSFRHYECDQPYGYNYDDYGYYQGEDGYPEGFVTGPNEWWIGNQPYLPYYGYNPPTVDGYYPPYAYSSMNNGYGYGYNGYGYNGYPSASGIVPAPPLASPPAYIPTFTTPVPPAPLRIRVTGRGIVTQRDPHFQLFYVPQPPNYLTTGSAIYQIPQQYYNYYYPPVGRR
ncbi:MAG TPA: hypothetical protein VHV83_00200 [Armatimonadota bacterium]|nr:hypothetical protein [Armatimonadota bacterium]